MAIRSYPYESMAYWFLRLKSRHIWVFAYGDELANDLH